MAPREGLEPERLDELLECLEREPDEAELPHIAEKFWSAYKSADDALRRDACQALLSRRLRASDLQVARQLASEDDRHIPASDLRALLKSTTSRCRLLLDRLQHAPGGSLHLVRMRADLLRWIRDKTGLDEVEAELEALLIQAFHRGSLLFRSLSWTDSADLLERLIAYEAVHPMDGWSDLRRRVASADRRCFAFLHPLAGHEPLIFTEIALTDGMPDRIAPILSAVRAPISPERATTAVFYSISNCQDGLRGVAFGNHLIKRAVMALKSELPHLTTFCTMSPLPGFGRWLQREIESPAVLPPNLHHALAPLRATPTSAERVTALNHELQQAACLYLVCAKAGDGGPAEAVARFHLSSGARLERVNAGADLSARGIAASYGVMSNFVYDGSEVAANLRLYREKGVIKLSDSVRRVLAATEGSSAIR